MSCSLQKTCEKCVRDILVVSPVLFWEVSVREEYRWMVVDLDPRAGYAIPGVTLTQGMECIRHVPSIRPVQLHLCCQSSWLRWCPTNQYGCRAFHFGYSTLPVLSLLGYHTRDRYIMIVVVIIIRRHLINRLFYPTISLCTVQYTLLLRHNLLYWSLNH